MTSSEDMANRPKPTPIYKQPVEVEGAYPPVAGLRELRHLLNSAWRGVYPDPNLANPEPAEEIQLRVELAQAELMYRQAVDDEQRRAGRLVGRDFERQTVPVEYVDAFVRRNGQTALEEGRRQGKEQAHAEVGEQLAAIHAALSYETQSTASLPAQIRAILADTTAAAEAVARIERAAYDRGLAVAGDHARRDFDEVRSDQANLRQQLTEVRAALGMSPDEDHDEVVNEIGLYRDASDQYDAAKAKLVRLRQLTNDTDMDPVLRTRLGEVLGR